MTTPDFSKIWASQSPLTPYEFSDEDYLEGWEFIGEIPPDRRMFDTWQKQADTKMQWLYSNTANWLRKNNTAYVLGDIAFSPSLPSYLVLKCTTAGTTAASEPDFSGATAGGTVTDGTVIWTYMNLLSIGHSIGEIFPYAGTTQPPGALLCNGAAVSRTMYPDLFDEIGTKYGAGDGSTSFNLPNLLDAALMNGAYTKTTYETAGSATFIASKTGFYKITVKGGGGGGGAGNIYSTTGAIGGSAGGEGGTTIGFEHLEAGDSVSVVVGAGGAGGATIGGGGGNGGDSTVTVNNTTYTGGGATNAFGGSGTITGACGGIGDSLTNVTAMTARGGTGGGTGGGFGGASTFSSTQNGVNGGGGAGGGAMLGGTKWANGGNGGDGYVWIEYIGASEPYFIQAFNASTDPALVDLTQIVQDLANKLTREQTPAFNKRDVITISGTYTAPVTGWYRITAKGGGGGGMSASYSTASNLGGGSGGGEGGTTIEFEHLEAGDSVSVVVGAGGAGGTSGGNGSDGGNTTVTANNNNYVGGGGKGGEAWYGGGGGTGTIKGAPGQVRTYGANPSYPGSSGGGSGASVGSLGAPNNAIDGGGGAGGAYNAGVYAGANGGNGFVWFEYFDGSLN